jgi:hypothetical protein
LSAIRGSLFHNRLDVSGFVPGSAAVRNGRIPGGSFVGHRGQDARQPEGARLVLAPRHRLLFFH